MKPKVYIETTIPSYLTARRSRDMLAAARQEITLDWWNEQRHRFDLYLSDLVLEEAESGDPEAASRRLSALAGIPSLDLTVKVEDLAAQFLSSGLIPAKAVDDAFHVALATEHGIDYRLPGTAATSPTPRLLYSLRNSPGHLVTNSLRFAPRTN